MHDLGSLQDLPPEYLEALRSHHLVPLWPSLRGVMPADRPQAKTETIFWPYRDIRPLLMQAGELTPIEKAERRVLVLANPGHGLEKMQASPSIYLGMQLLLPGEWAPAHRHTPNAVRMVVEGEGAYTTVEGEHCAMKRGDLILTPTGLWHEHRHEGNEPVIWLDVLDLPLVYYLEASYREAGPSTPAENRITKHSPAYWGAGLAPLTNMKRNHSAYPMLHYPFEQVKKCLDHQVPQGEEPAALSYINPETGSDALQILGFYALKLKPLQSCALPIQSSARVMHVIEGQCNLRSGLNAESRGAPVSLAEADTACVPGYASSLLTNLMPEQACYLFLADEAPLHRKLGIYETRS